MKRFLGRVWSVWFSFWFILVYLLIFPFHVLFLAIPRRWAHDISHHLNTFWGYCIMYTSFLLVTWEGRKHLKPGAVYIYCPNHSSYLDIPTCNIALNRSFRYLGKAELNSVPLFGYMYKRLNITVNRKSITDAFKSFALTKENLQKGISMLIFPEGTIGLKNIEMLGTFKEGAFKLSTETGIPIVPITIVGTHKAMPSDGRFRVWPARIRVFIHAPIYPEGKTSAELSQITYNTISTHLEKYRHEYYA